MAESAALLLDDVLVFPEQPVSNALEAVFITISLIREAYAADSENAHGIFKALKSLCARGVRRKGVRSLTDKAYCSA